MNGIIAIVGTACILIGLISLFSLRFLEFALGDTPQGRFWKTSIGEHWGAGAVKFVFSAIFVAVGAWLIYDALPWQP